MNTFFTKRVSIMDTVWTINGSNKEYVMTNNTIVPINNRGKRFPVSFGGWVQRLDGSSYRTFHIIKGNKVLGITSYNRG